MDFCISCGKIFDKEDLKNSQTNEYCIFCRDKENKKTYKKQKEENVKKIESLLGYNKEFSEKLVLVLMKKHLARGKTNNESER